MAKPITVLAQCPPPYMPEVLNCISSLPLISWLIFLLITSFKAQKTKKQFSFGLCIAHSA